MYVHMIESSPSTQIVHLPLYQFIIIRYLFVLKKKKVKNHILKLNTKEKRDESLELIISTTFSHHILRWKVENMAAPDKNWKRRRFLIKSAPTTANKRSEKNGEN